MPSRMRSGLRLLVAAVALPLALWAFLPLVSAGAPGPDELQRKMERKRDQIRRRKGRERVLASDVAGYSRRIRSLQAEVAALQRRQVRLQADLDAKRAQLGRIRERLRQERVRLARLRARLTEARSALATRLVEMYKSDTPDVVTVVLQADGFADLLERTEFMQRVSAQDSRIIRTVREAKREATRSAERLERLAARAERIARSIATQRNQVAMLKSQLADRRERYREARSEKSALLSSTREDRRELESQLAALERENARVVAALRRAAPSPPDNGGGDGAAPPAGPIRPGSGGLIWPVNGPITSPFGPRWGRLHAGLDIGASQGTPIRAADSGRVALAGSQGAYGLYTCIQHSGSLSTCYAHQSRIDVSVGQSASKGQVIGAVGNTGRSFGAHLHFETRVNGSPVNPMGYL
jgi:murein DD-endopeptidase MepM/ murein hydrolase activator NlpD